MAATAEVLVDFGALTNIEGYVEHPDGSPIANAEVETSFLGRASTDERGYFLVTQRPADRGPIDVRVSLRTGTAHRRAERLRIEPRRNGRTDAGLFQLQRVHITTDVPVCDNTAQRLRVLDSDANLRAELRLGFSVSAMARDVSGDVVLAGGTTLARVQFEPSLRVLWSVEYPEADFQAVAIAPEGTLWMLDQGPAKQLLHSGQNGLPLRSYAWPTLPTPNQGTGIAVMPSNGSAAGYYVYATMWYERQWANTGYTMRLEPVSGSLALSEASYILGLGLSPNGDVWTSIAGGPSQLWRYDPGLTSVIARVTVDSSRAPWGIAFRPDGTMAVASTHPYDSDVIYQIDPAISYPWPPPYVGLPGRCYSTALWLAGDGNLWVPRPGCQQLSIVTPGGVVRTLDSAVSATRGDPTGYTQALIIHPEEDFDEDGIGNRAELVAGRNPFDQGR